MLAYTKKKNIVKIITKFYNTLYLGIITKITMYIIIFSDVYHVCEHYQIL